jgi:hypothetical protein
MAGTTTVLPIPALQAKVIKLKFPKKARNRRKEYRLRLIMQARAGDVGAVAEGYFAAMRDELLKGDAGCCPYYWAEYGIAAVRKLRRLAGKKALIGRKAVA